MPSHHLGIVPGALVLSLLLPAPADTAERVLCSAISPLDGSTIDVTPSLEACVRETDEGGILELPPGKFTLSRTWRIRKGITIRTHGKTEDMPRCHYVDAPDCAELVMRSSACVVVAFDAPVAMDHVVVNGNKYERLGSAVYSTTHTSIRGGVEMTSGSRFINSVVKYVTCGASLLVARGAADVAVTRSSIAFNGFHHAHWADGVTVLNAYNATVTDNLLIDNTDVQMIFGGCRGCRIQRNEITHSSSFSAGSFAALILSAMVVEGGSFEGTHISNNRIDCGPYRRCGFGLYYGNEAWNTLDALIRGYAAGWRLGGGAIYDNHISNAQTGLNLGRTTSVVAVHNNTVVDSGGRFTSRCGPFAVTRANSAYNIIPGAMLDRSLDTVPTSSYTNQDWVNCIPNWTSAVYGPMDPSETGMLSSIGAAKVSITCPRWAAAGTPVTCTASGAGAILSGYWTVAGERYVACDNRPTCSLPGSPPGTHEIQVVAEAPGGTLRSNVSRVNVLSGASPDLWIWCPTALPTGETAQCIARMDGPVGSGYWTVNGVRVAGCDNQLTCGGTISRSGSYDVAVVAQTAAGVITSNTARISVTGTLPAISVDCATTATCGPTAVCVASATVPLGGIYWLVNGFRYAPCDNQGRCSGTDLPPGTYTVRVVGLTATGEVRSEPDVFNVP